MEKKANRNFCQHIVDFTMSFDNDVNHDVRFCRTLIVTWILRIPVQNGSWVENTCTYFRLLLFDSQKKSISIVRLSFPIHFVRNVCCECASDTRQLNWPKYCSPIFIELSIFGYPYSTCVRPIITIIIHLFELVNDGKLSISSAEYIDGLLKID